MCHFYVLNNIYFNSWNLTSLHFAAIRFSVLLSLFSNVTAWHTTAEFCFLNHCFTLDYCRSHTQVKFMSNVVTSHKPFHQKKVIRSLVGSVDYSKQFNFLPVGRGSLNS